MFTSPNNVIRVTASTKNYPEDALNVLGIPSVSIQNGRLQVGDAHSSAHRSFTPIKTLGGGAFGTVLLCDWHGSLPFSSTQCGGGARPGQAGKRLVAVKRMRKRWEGGWDECKRLQELESLRAIPFHPCIVALYDFFLRPDTKELFLVFERMEGNLLQLIKSRAGRPLAGGLVASIFRQIVSGLHHVHASGYFHRDMKPENVLVTTTGVFEYRSLSPVAPPTAPTEPDVVTTVKLADFGLARATASAPPYTEYVSTRWYRAPEVLLCSRVYSNPVDMWAFGTIMAELVNLRPLFPGSGQIDQMHRICEILGDPVDYGSDAGGRSLGGGKWNKGLEMANHSNIIFPKVCQPKDFYSCFDHSIPRKLIECISDLLKYDPDARLTSRQCLEHPYLIEALPHNTPPMPGTHVQTLPTTPSRPHTNGASHIIRSASPRSVPSSHSPFSLAKSPYRPAASLPDTGPSRNTAFVPSVINSTTHARSVRETTEHANDLWVHSRPPPSSDIIEEARTQASSAWPLNHAQSDSDQMDVSPPSPQVQIPEDIQMSTMPLQTTGDIPPQDAHHPAGSKLSRFGSSLGFGRKNPKWVLGVFGRGERAHRQPLPPVDEVPGSTSTPSLKRTQSANSGHSVADGSPANARKDAKAIKREAERLQLEAEMQRRALAERSHREQARDVVHKRNQMLMQTTTRNELEWKWTHSGSLLNVSQRPSCDDLNKGRTLASGAIRQNQSGGKVSSPTLHAASGRYLKPPDTNSLSSDRRLPRDERLTKVRRRDFDDDHSMSSGVHSTGRMSVMSSATVASDPGPSRVGRATDYSANRLTSFSSLRTDTTSYDDFPAAGSSSSISLDHQFNEFNIRASFDTASSVSGPSSPPPINPLSLSSPPNPWIHSHESHESATGYVVTPVFQHPSFSPKSYECDGQLYGHPPADLTDSDAAINPIFKVTLLPTSPSDDNLSSPQPLPPFSHLEAVADGEHPPRPHMLFHPPEDG